jgi:hypothetical protein
VTIVSAIIPGSAIPDSELARLVCPGVGTLVLPWWPTEVEHGAWAPDYAETARPGRTPVLTRSSDPLPTMRLAFTLRTDDVGDSIAALLAMVRTLAAAKPAVQVMLGPSDRGRWRITEAGATETDWSDTGSASVADVVLAMRRESDAAIVVGPIRKKPKPRR